MSVGRVAAVTEHGHGLAGSGWRELLGWLARLRADEPVALRDGMHHVVRAEDVRTVLSDAGAFSSDRTALMPPTALLGRGNLTMMDPPDHTRMRRIVGQAFTPGAVGRLRDTVDTIARDLVDALDPGSFDVVRDLGHPLPIRVIAALLGLPDTELAGLAGWSAAFSRGDAQAMDEMHAFLMDVVATRRRHPDAGLISAMASARVDGVPATDSEIAALAGLLLLAGHVTTTSLIAACVLELCAHPALEPAVRAEDRVEDLVAEALRVRPAFAQVVRIATRDVEIAGRTIPEGGLVAAWILSANHDPSLNADPDEFLLDRPHRRHLAFGHGVHFCLGAPLARLEAVTALRVLLRRVDAISPLEAPSFHPSPTFAVRTLVVGGRAHAR